MLKKLGSTHWRALIEISFKRTKLNSSQFWVGYSIVVLIRNERRMIPNRPQIDRGLIMDDGILMFVIAFIIAPILIWIATVIYG